MAREKTWEAIPPVQLIVDGAQSGKVTLASTRGFRVGMRVFLQSSTLPVPKEFKIKRVSGSSALFVGPIDQGIEKRSDVSMYLVAEGAFIFAPEQPKVTVPKDDQTQASWEHEPVNARRVISVDELGNPYSAENPLPVDAANVLIVGSEDGTKAGDKYAFVNNVKLQILASHDREQEITYADFGTKKQRIVQIEYSSPTFPGVVALQSISYTLVGNRYRRDNITWSIV